MTDLERLLGKVAAGETSPEEAAQALGTYGFADLGFARVDHGRRRRCGFPEVIYGAGKTPEQVTAIAGEMRRADELVLATRLSEQAMSLLQKEFPDADIQADARSALIGPVPAPIDGNPPVMVVAAGTSDIPVAGEALTTCRALGVACRALYDVGVAGLHRLLAYRAELEAAGALVVVAGMEGALPSVVAGLVRAPVIACPTSVGYGVSLGGVAALLAMLNSCASGVAVVNIDNGFGAGYVAGTICRRDLVPPAPPAGLGSERSPLPGEDLS